MIFYPSFLTRRMVGGGNPLYLKVLNFVACTQRLSFVRCTEVMATWLCLQPAVLPMVCCLRTKRLS